MKPVAPRWTGLLVSVRDAAEASAAVAGGAAIVDVKEPASGPLGAASAASAAAAAAAVAGRVPWTLACGELAAGGAAAAAVVAAAVAALPSGTQPPAAAKAGPAGLTLDAWRREFVAFAAALPAVTFPVAVAYADWRVAAAPPPNDLLAAAAAVGCRILLVDTFDKAGAGILDPDADVPLADWISAAHAAEMAVAVAGRIAAGDVGRAAALGADVVAVRSAACRGGRMGVVERSLVAAAVTAAAATLMDAPRHRARRQEPALETA